MSGSAICRSTSRAARRDARRQLGGGAAEAQPLARAVDPLDACALDLERRRRLLEVDDERPLAAVALLQLGDAAVPDQPAVVDHEQPVAEPLDVAQVVRRQQHGDALARG